MQRLLGSNWARLAWIVPILAGCTAETTGPRGETLAHEEGEIAVLPDELATTWRAQDGWRISPVLAAPEGATRVGVLVDLRDAAAMPAIEARARLDGAASGRWIPVEVTWSESDHHVAIAELGTIADGAELRIAASAVADVQSLRWNAVVPEVALEAEADSVGTASEALRSELSGLGIVTRDRWGARPTRCTDANASKTKMAIHYTVTPSADPARQVRGVQAFHMDSRGWCDVGYHFLVGIDGSIYEGRPLELLGAHVGGENTGNIGISFVGCFHPTGCPADYGPKQPSTAMIESGGRLLGALSRLYGIPLDATRVKGHRDHAGQSTSCPGDYLRARIPDLLRIGRDDGGTTPPAAGSCTHRNGGVYAAGGCSAGYQCCSGAWATRGSCGACACVEATGETGCAATSEPPAGAACTHSFGGRYATAACSASYQCCNGAWSSKGACGACFCSEATGRTGCGT